MKFRVIKQHNISECGPTCIRMIALHYGESIEIEDLRNACGYTPGGTTLKGLINACSKYGYLAHAIQADIEGLRATVNSPCIVHWNNNHYVVLYKIKNDSFYIADPMFGKIKLGKKQFQSHFIKDDLKYGHALLIRKNEECPTSVANKNEHSLGLSSILNYFNQSDVALIIIGIFLGIGIPLVIPTLFKALVDYGIHSHNVEVICLILLCQLTAILGKALIDFYRAQLLMHSKSSVTLTIASRYIFKIISLPLSQFDSKIMGSVFQRLNDIARIEQFINAMAMNFISSLLTASIFIFILLFTDIYIATVFLCGSFLSILWTIIFQKKRRYFDYHRFDLQSNSHTHLMQTILGIEDVKINCLEKDRLQYWSNAQKEIVKNNINGAIIDQTQILGSGLISELKNIVISFITASAVIDGSLTLGSLVSIGFIVGQLNSTVSQVPALVNQLQDVRMGIVRTRTILDTPSEIELCQANLVGMPTSGSIEFKGVSFRYASPHSVEVLKNISFTAPQGKVTGIVGGSGSGKTTLFKLLLKYFTPERGNIYINGVDIQTINHSTLRKEFGVVLQDGFVFSDTIEANISLSESCDMDRLKIATMMANIYTDILKMPKGFKTPIGIDGVKLSMGQKQRLLIARALYKKPTYLLLDEPTSNLDGINECVINTALNDVKSKLTTIVIAHRLSTILACDNLIVMKDGAIVEQGEHKELVKLGGYYYDLLQGQLQNSIL